MVQRGSIKAMGYKLLGYVVWQGGKCYLRRRYGRAPRKLLAGGIVAPPDYWHIHEIGSYATWAVKASCNSQRPTSA